MKSTEVAGQDALHGGRSRRQLAAARDLTLGGLFGALALVLPVIFHAVGLGQVFLPMYLPVLALGLLASWEVALLAGLMVPLLSAALSGMPPLPIAPLMVVELAALGAVSSLARSRGLGVWPAAVAGCLAARMAGLAVLLSVLPYFGLHQSAYEYAIAGVIASAPGMALLLTVVPGAVYALERASILGRRDRRQRTHG